MLLLTVLRFKQSLFREASSFKNKEGQEINVPAHYLCEVDFANKQYSKMAKGQIVKPGNKEIKSDCELPASGEWLCEVEPKGDDFKIVRIISKADLNALLVKPVATNQTTAKKETKNEGTL